MKIKKLLFFLLVFTFPIIAFSQNETPANAKSGVPIKVNKDYFLKHIYNYEKNPNQWVYQGNLPCIIDFYADWCGPCRQMKKVLDEVAKTYKGKVIVYKVDVEAQRELASYFGIQSLPTLIFVPLSGKPRGIMGYVPLDDLTKIMKDVLKTDSPDTKEI